MHNAFPDKNIYFTEQWVGAPGNLVEDLNWHVKNLVIGAARNWSRIVLEWNLTSNPQFTPHTDRGGCDRCLGAVTISGNQVTRNSAYYIIAHASKFVRPGSTRIASSDLPSLPNVAFKSSDGKHVLIVLNAGTDTAAVRHRLAGATLPHNAQPKCRRDVRVVAGGTKLSVTFGAATWMGGKSRQCPLQILYIKKIGIRSGKASVTIPSSRMLRLGTILDFTQLSR